MEYLKEKIIPPAVGTCGAILGLLTGPIPFWHELGHALVAKALYKMEEMPTIWVAGMDRFQEIFYSETPFQLLQHTSSWISGGLIGPQPAHWSADLPSHAVGFTHWKSEEMTSLGQWLGEDASHALVSIAGPLLVTATCIGGAKLGFQQHKKHRWLAPCMIAFFAVTHFISLEYCWEAVWMSESQLASPASRNHDFAAFAQSLSSLTGLAAPSIALATASCWTASFFLV